MKFNIKDLQKICREELSKPKNAIKLPPGTDGSPAHLKSLYGIHLYRYSERLARAIHSQNPHERASYNQAELRDLLAIWQEVRAKNFVYDDLSPNAQSEVYDAIMDDEG